MTASFPIADAAPLPVLTDITVDARTKGFPGNLSATPLAEVGAKGWNVLRRDMPTPLAVLDVDALAHNAKWIAAVTAHYGVSLCPHGKTTMAPQLFHRQLADGCWGITLSTQHQVCAARHYGVSRILLANQITDPVFLDYIAQEQEKDDAFEFYFLIDSQEGIDLMVQAAGGHTRHRPFRPLVEIGSLFGRTGCRTQADALALAERIASMPEVATLAGIEGFEGAIRGADSEELEGRITDFLALMNDTAVDFEQRGLFAGPEILLTAGGSSFFDLVARILTKSGLKSPNRVVLRSGCYITHDAVMYEEQISRALRRSPELAELSMRPRQALTVWALVLSRPADDVLYLNVGRRDVSFDSHLPRLLAYVDPKEPDLVRPLPGDHATTLLYDQHACVRCSADSPLRPGMLVRLGISHPCTTFDKWDVISLVDRDHNVLGAVKTFF